MSDLEIVHPVPVEEVRPWVATLSTTFLQDVEHENFNRLVDAYRRDWPEGRAWGARVDGRWVATLVTEERTVTVPGPHGTTKDLRIDALTAVTVNATHRRRGLLTQMLTDSLRAAHERGDPISALIAAEWPIYGRFGYAPAAFDASYTYYSRRAQLLPAATGRLRQVDPAELATIAPEIFERARRRSVGQIDRRGEWWARRLGLDGYQPFRDGKSPNIVLHETADGPDGLVFWSAERDFDIDGKLGAVSVSDLIAASDTAYRNLWAYLGGIDVVDEIKLSRRPIDEPIRWLLPDGRALRQSYTGDAMWLRILDAAAALAARNYRTEGRLVLDVVDQDVGGYATGRYELIAAEDGSKCEPTGAAPDLQVSQRALASIYLGGLSLRQLRLAGQVSELTDGAIERADLMFGADVAPWNATGF